jgi:hypothetical protein
LWHALLIGPFLIAFGIWEYHRLDAFEHRGGYMVLDRFTAFFYDIGGKTTVLYGTIGMGVGYMLLLAYWWRTVRAGDKKQAAVDAVHAELGNDQPAPVQRPLRKRGDVPPAPVASPGDGPFRGGPAPVVQVIRTERPATRPEVVPGGADGDGPKILR